MAILNNSNAISPSGYDVNNSLRFRSSASAYLNRTPASAGNRKTWTWSAWIKRGELATRHDFFSAGTASNNTDTMAIRFDSSANLTLAMWSADIFQTSQVFRDPSAWYHIVLAMDTTQATASNRTKLYINGTQVTNFTSISYPSQNADLGINGNVTHNIGRLAFSGGAFYFDGYMAEVNFIDGQALTPSSFGSTNATTGVWQPAKYTGTYGTNGFYLKFSDIATTSGSNAGLGKDFSGNANYFNTNNISVTAGTTYDAMIDSPTLTSATVANYAVGNPINNSASGNITFSQANLALSLGVSGQWRTATATMSMPSGKWYWEVTKTNSTTSNDAMIGIIADTVNISGAYYPSQGALGYTYLDGGQKGNAAGGSAYGASWTNGDVIGVAFDAGTGQLTFYKNGTSQGLAFTVTSGYSYYPAFGGASSVPSYAINFGQRPFAYTPPSGFVALNTFNLPNSTIVKGNTVMDATLWTGNGASNRLITNAGSFRPDFVWIKARSDGYNNALYDSVRGTGKALFSNATEAEATVNDFTAFNSNGFTVDGSTRFETNRNGSTYVGWQWQAGQGTNTTNTSGSITSTVSVNTTAGFSVLTWTGNGSAGATIGHSLGVAPKWIIVKRRNSSGDDWLHYHTSLGATKSIAFDTAAAITSSTRWNNTAPSSTVITLGTSTGVNASGQTYVAYCWAEIAGFSRFGSYTGNGSTDGTFVYTGFRPKFVMVKRTDTTGNWRLVDTTRGNFNATQYELYPNLSNAEGTATYDILSNGFKNRETSADYNASGGTYIYMAFAENPFKNANAR